MASLCEMLPQRVRLDYIELLKVVNELQYAYTQVGDDATKGAVAALMSIAMSPESADEFFEQYSAELKKLGGRQGR